MPATLSGAGSRQLSGYEPEQAGITGSIASCAKRCVTTGFLFCDGEAALTFDTGALLHALLSRPYHRRRASMRIYSVKNCIEQKGWLWLRRKRLTRLAGGAEHLVRSNQEWALDFVCDTLATGRGIRVLTVVDAFTRENLSLDVDTSLSSSRVTRSLDAVIARRGKPQSIRCDNGPEFTSRHFLSWCEQQKIQLIHITSRGRPIARTASMWRPVLINGSALSGTSV